jgi:hypothetical protein
MEEYEKNPTDALEWLLLSFANEIAFREGVPETFRITTVKIIGKKLAIIRAKNIGDEDIASQDDQMTMDLDDSDSDMDDEDIFGEEIIGNDISSSDADDLTSIIEHNAQFERIKFTDSSYWERSVQDFGVADLLRLMTNTLALLSADMLKQNLTLILDIVKTEYNNPSISELYPLLTETLITNAEVKEAEVADEISTSFVEWIRATNNEIGSTDRLSKTLKSLLSVCSNKDLLALNSDVTTKLAGWVVNGIYHFHEVDFWTFLVARLEDPAEAVVQMSAKINEYATGGDDYEEYSAITTMQKLLENGTFELTFDLFPSLFNVWKIEHEEFTGDGVSVYEKATFIEAAVKHCPEFVESILPEALNFLELQSTKHVAGIIMAYAMVINLVKDEEPWIHHMKRLLACFTLPNNFFKISHARARLVLYDLLLPLHRHHLKLLQCKNSILLVLQQVQQLFGDGEGVGVDGEKKVIDGLAWYYQKICTLSPSSRAYTDAFLAELAKNYNAEKIAYGLDELQCFLISRIQSMDKPL